MEFIKDRLYINRNLQPAIIISIDSNGTDYPISVKLLNREDDKRFLCSDGSYLGNNLKSQNDIVTEIILYEYKNEHLINDVFYLSIDHSRRMSYTHDNGISYDNKNCAISILTANQVKKINIKLERLQYCIRSHRWNLKKIKHM